MNKVRKHKANQLVVRSKDKETKTNNKAAAKIVDIDRCKQNQEESGNISEKLIFAWLNPFV